jgi:hypothetical protein
MRRRRARPPRPSPGALGLAVGALAVAALLVFVAASAASRPALPQVPDADRGIAWDAPLWPGVFPLVESSSGKPIADAGLPVYVDASGQPVAAPLGPLLGRLAWVGPERWTLLFLVAAAGLAVVRLSSMPAARAQAVAVSLVAAGVVVGLAVVSATAPDGALPGLSFGPGGPSVGDKRERPDGSADKASSGSALKVPGAVQPLPAAEVSDPRFGVVDAFRLGDRKLAAALGARYERLLFWWSDLERAPGAALNPYYFPRGMVDRERREGYELVGLIMNTPGWAAANPGDGPRSVPRNLYLPWDHPDNYWGRFVERLAREYAGRVDDWIVWNEPDIRPGDPNASYYAWAGGVEDYNQLLRVAYRAAKKGNPAARVHLAGLTYWVDRHAGRPQYFERLLDLIAADPSAPANNYYFDVATLHLYADPRTVYRVPREYRELMRARGLDKPIRINETNAIPWDDPTNEGTGYDRATDMRCTLADQASYVLQAFSLALAADVERIAVYKAQDGHGATRNGEVDAIERAALVREDGSLRPAFLAYQTAVRYLSEGRARYVAGPRFDMVLVERPGGERTTVLWNGTADPVEARLPAAGADAALVDAVGQVQSIAPEADGAYAIPLPPATCKTDPNDPKRYIMGGPTHLVVER